MFFCVENARPEFWLMLLAIVEVALLTFSSPPLKSRPSLKKPKENLGLGAKTKQKSSPSLDTTPKNPLTPLMLMLMPQRPRTFLKSFTRSSPRQSVSLSLTGYPMASHSSSQISNDSLMRFFLNTSARPYSLASSESWIAGDSEGSRAAARAKNHHSLTTISSATSPGCAWKCGASPNLAITKLHLPRTGRRRKRLLSRWTISLRKLTLWFHHRLLLPSWQEEEVVWWTHVIGILCLTACPQHPTHTRLLLLMLLLLALPPPPPLPPPFERCHSSPPSALSILSSSAFSVRVRGASSSLLKCVKIIIIFKIKRSCSVSIMRCFRLMTAMPWGYWWNSTKGSFCARTFSTEAEKRSRWAEEVL